ncbi:hypothetical protein L6164_017701 [Bauhinia variegata]|uniref:Uncharacterized protein n=1 Tax=Bauhinia variegata TaxID=167791 RepID=A0ACB9NAR0_BAUVA|nr:hypothetical protein L6164_017701 [Bauhinia variegata]
MAGMQRTPLGAVYEDFQPKLEKTETPEAHFLQVHLPGFTRDQVKVRYVTSTKAMSVSGERPVGGNKWIRFRESYPVPENCELNKLRGNFDQGMLTITMPKKFITPVAPKEELETSEDTITSMEEPDTSLGAVYEEFQPKTEMTENPEAYHLQVHLPGFTKEQVKIKYNSSSRVISISGERPIEGGKKWSRVEQQYPVPENFNEQRLGAKFATGILTITMPKKYITPAVPKEELKTSEDTTTSVEEPKYPSLDDVYEEFQPQTEIIERPETYLLKVFLPGFTKDQVKIKYIGSSRMISISGERPIEGGKRWSRVEQQFHAPENFNEQRLGAKFDVGILTITMPKKFITPDVPKEEPKTSEDTTPSVEEPKEPSLGAVYEEFQPKGEMTENPEAYILQVHLPGFTMEHIKIKYINTSRVISISGERPIEEGKRWSRVEQQYPVPENFKEEGLVAKFDQGILTIKLPKKFPSLVAPKEEVKTSQDTGPSPLKEAMVEPKPQKAEEMIPPKAVTTSEEELKKEGTVDAQEPIRESKPQKGPEEIVQKAPIGPVYEEFQPKSEMVENPEAYHMQIQLPGFTRDQVKIKYVSSLKVMSISGERPIEGENRWLRVNQAYPVPDNCDAGRVQGKFDMGILTITMPKKFIPPVPRKEEVKAIQEKVPSPLEKYMADVAKPAEKAPAMVLPPKASVEGKSIEDIAAIIGKGIQEMSASASSAVTSIGDGVLNDEEKHLMAMVIATLGAYVSYRISTSGKHYN